jgi:hypothetical protein
MDLENFALEATAHSAVVMIALHGGPEDNGAVQRHLESNEIPFTGPNSRAVEIAGNQVALIRFWGYGTCLTVTSSMGPERSSGTVAHLHNSYTCL